MALSRFRSTAAQRSEQSLFFTKVLVGVKDALKNNPSKVRHQQRTRQLSSTRAVKAV
jgi:hypothetical protein